MFDDRSGMRIMLEEDEDEDEDVDEGVSGEKLRQLKANYYVVKKNINETKQSEAYPNR